MIDRARVRQFEESVGFIHLLQICLQEPSCYNAPKHVGSDLEGAITSRMGLRKESVDSGVIVGFERAPLKVSSTVDRDQESSNTFSIFGHSCRRSKMRLIWKEGDC